MSDTSQPPLGAVSRMLGSLLLPQPKATREPVYRWIMYLHAPGGLGFDVQRVTSFEDAKAALIQYGKDTGFYQDLTVYGDYGPTGALYPYTAENWEDAEEYRHTGCPFDYPSYLVQSGPRGGVRVTPA